MGAPTVISTFAGCGGSSLGYKMAGFRELLAIDWEAHACETFRANFPDVPCWQRDITTIIGKEIMDFCKIKEGELDVLDGSPPCQGFSTFGKRKVNDTRNYLFMQYARLLGELKPKVFVMENVSGMAKGDMRGIFNSAIAELKSKGYRVAVKQLNAANYGVPQSRQRIFFIGAREDQVFDPANVFVEMKRTMFISSGEALVGLDIAKEEKIILKGKHLDVWRKMRPGHSAQEILGPNNGFSFRKLDPKRPSITVLKTFSPNGLWAGITHWAEPRYLTIGEYKRICSFPDDFKIEGKITDQVARLGNAVMPLQMKAIAETIKKEILEK